MYRPGFGQLAARVRSKLLFIPASLHLIAALRGKRPTEFWIGDSHAMSTNHAIVSSMFMRGAEGQLILRAGARLLYSISQNGWGPRITRVVRLISPFVKRGSLVPIFSAGEIDIRAHLAKRPDETYEFVHEYVDQCEQIVRQLKAEKSAYMWPTPQCAMPQDQVWFPMVGTLAERFAISLRLREALAEAIGTYPHAVLLDFNDALADPATGGIRPEFTDDGAHTNLAAVAVVRKQIADYRLLER